MVSLVFTAVLLAANNPSALDRLDALGSALERTQVHALALEHDAPPLRDDDRRALGAALEVAATRFDEVLKTPEAMAVEDARDLWTALGDAERAARDWTAARKIGDARAMRVVARQIREAVDRAQAIVSAAEAQCE